MAGAQSGGSGSAAQSREGAQAQGALGDQRGDDRNHRAGGFLRGADRWGDVMGANIGYKKLVTILRNCADENKTCCECPRFEYDDGFCVYGGMGKLISKAADAIEELTRAVALLASDRDAERKLRLDAESKIPRWIPVTVQLPVGGDDSGAVCENVCLLMDDGTVSCGWMNGITQKVYYLNARDDVVIKAPITRVTYWMPLPEPPKEEET